MRFKVPKFLEKEIKIVSFLTFKQLTLVGISSLVLIVLYYLVSTAIFISALIIIGGIVFVFLFLKIEGIPIGHIIIQSFNYFLLPRTYIWKKKETLTPFRLVEKQPQKNEEKEEKSLKVSPESKLRKLASKIEIGLK